MGWLGEKCATGGRDRERERVNKSAIPLTTSSEVVQSAAPSQSVHDFVPLTFYCLAYFSEQFAVLSLHSYCIVYTGKLGLIFSAILWLNAAVVLPTSPKELTE